MTCLDCRQLVNPLFTKEHMIINYLEEFRPNVMDGGWLTKGIAMSLDILYDFIRYFRPM